MDFHTVNKRPMDGGLLTCDIAKALHVQTQNSNTGIYISIAYHSLTQERLVMSILK